jgi:hypothetical protein
MSIYRVHPQFCSLAPPPPRTPARPDPQVPRELNLGPARWGKIGALYFYRNGDESDPAFGLFDIEVSLQRLTGGRVRVELYAIGDGYQQRGVKGAEHPLSVRLKRDAETLLDLQWVLPDILDGHADPVAFERTERLSEDDWRSVDRVEIDTARR